MAIDPATELAQFKQFIVDHLQKGDILSPEEALDLWRLTHPISDDLADSVSALREALADLDSGERGVPLDEFDREFRRRHNLPLDG
jgi:hypothetical protein